MTANVLVATPRTAFGELLRLSLEECGKYRVRLAQTPGEVQAASGRIPFDLAILDASLGETTLAPLAQALRSANRSLRLVVIPPDNDPTRLPADGLEPDAILSLPFYAPDLLETVGSLLAISGHVERPGAASAGSAAPALGDQPEVEKLLASLLSQTSAQAMFILRNRAVWACVGQIDHAHVQELADALNRGWDENDPSDLARFSRTSKGSEVMLYATTLSVGTLLALAYDPSTPLMRIRGQVGMIAQAIRAAQNPNRAPSEPLDALAELSTAAEEQSLSSTAAGEPLIAGMKVSDEELAELLSADSPSGQEAQDLLLALEQAGGKARPGQGHPPAETLRTQPETIDSGKDIAESKLLAGEEESPEVSLTDLLAAMPPPNPQERSLAPGNEWIEGEEKEAELDRFLFPWEMETQAITQQSSNVEDVQLEQTAAASVHSLEHTVPILHAADNEEATRQLATPSSATQRIPSPTAVEIEPTQPLPPIQNLWQQAEELETPPTEFASLSYTCIMLPRLPNHMLTGRLARKLAEWLKQICLAYGWRLEAQSVRPEYFQWTVQVSPVISPSSLVRLVRLQTSQRIFGSFGRYAVQIPSGDFWAPGYLIISGSQPPDTGLLRDYIQQTRKRQGL